MSNTIMEASRQWATMTGADLEKTHTLYEKRCKSIALCEFGSITELINDEFISIARTKEEPHAIVGIFRVRHVGKDLFKLMCAQVFDPPVDVEALSEIHKSAYKVLMSQEFSAIIFQDMPAPVLHGRN